MKYFDRDGKEFNMDNSQDKLLKLIYSSSVGRRIIKLLISPVVSKIGGCILDSKPSKIFIKPFVKYNKINMKQYENINYKSYNDFFMRKVMPNERKIDYNNEHFISPCDSKLSIYQIDDKLEFYIKNTKYSIGSLLRDKRLASQYLGGQIMVFRLTVDDYHRYCYVDDGIKTNNRLIRGVFHTVNPIANDTYPIYKENTREYSLLKSDNFGKVIMMEVGALMVGKIVNYHNAKEVKRGQEKGRFEFGGSTIVLILENNKVVIDNDIIKNSLAGAETKVKYGEKIGIKSAK